jgi:hypothetical protein
MHAKNRDRKELSRGWLDIHAPAAGTTATYRMDDYEFELFTAKGKDFLGGVCVVCACPRLKG